VTTELRRFGATSVGETHDRHAERPSKIPTRRGRDALVRVWVNFSRDNISVIAAGMAFFAFLAIPPGLTALVSLYGLLADPADIEYQLTGLLGVLPEDAIRLISHQLTAIAQNSTSSLSLSFIVSLSIALWSARSGISTLMTAINIAYKQTETRGIIRFNFVALVLTFSVTLVSVVSLLLVAILPLILDLIPFHGAAPTVARFARWPILAILMIIVLAMIYRFAPSREHAKWRWISWGAAAGGCLWLVVSALFSLYVEALAPYNRLYGSLGAVVVLMTWLYLTCLAVLFGAELDAVIEQQTMRHTELRASESRPAVRRG
jgi:membrane protein